MTRPMAMAFIRALRDLCVTHDMAIILLSHPSAAGMSSVAATSTGSAQGMRLDLWWVPRAVVFGLIAFEPTPRSGIAEAK